MSRKLDSLKENYLSNSTLPNLVEYLEQCKKEELWDEIISTLDEWKGSENAETNFYYGVSLLYLGKRKEGSERLLKVVKINPNHFNARRELEKFNISEEDEGKSSELNNDALKKILVIQPKVEDSEYYKRVKYRNIFIVILLLSAVAVALHFLTAKDKAGDFNSILKHPEKNFHSVNYDEYVRNVRDYKVLQIKDDIGEPLNRIIFYLTAYAILDYRLERERDDTSQFKLYSTLITKDERSSTLIDYIYGTGKPVGTELFHKYEKEFPESLPQIKTLDIKIPQEVDRANLRESYYLALMLFRRSDFDGSKKIVDKILQVFPNHELTAKLNVMIKSQSAIEAGQVLKNISDERILLDNLKTHSQERHLYGEALFLLGKAAQNIEVQREGFYSVCPGRYFCNPLVKELMNKGATKEASRMALFMREQKDNRRESEDIKLVLLTSFADGDYSNCYFSFKELQQYFPDAVDEEVIKLGAQCSEENGYYEEAVKAYELLNKKNQVPEITAKILRMKFAMTREELFYNQLKELALKNTDNLLILYPYLDALKRAGEIDHTVSTLDKIYELESQENRMSIINEYLESGAVMQAVLRLSANLNQLEYRKRLSQIYNRYMLFDKADQVLRPGEDHSPTWKFFKEQYSFAEKEEAYENVIREVDKKLQSLDKCEPAFLFLKAEIFRKQGDRQRTLGMIDAMIECDRFYMPGLIFAAEITYYQGDITRATEGLTYILNHEKYFSPGDLYYRNFLVLLNAEIMVTMGRDAQLEKYLKRNLIKNFPLGPKEMEKVNDISSKLKLSRQKGFMDYLRRNFKILKSEN